MKQSVGASILVMATVAAVSLVAPGALGVAYTTPSNVNLLQRVDPLGNFATVITGTTQNGGLHDAHSVYRTVDGGYQPWRVDNHGSIQTLRYELPQAVVMDQLNILWRSPFFANNFTVKGSATGWGDITPLWDATGGSYITVTGNANGNPIYQLRDPVNHSIPATVKYLEIEATAFNYAGYYITYEVKASNSAAGSVQQQNGYNLFAQPGKLGTVTADMQRRISGDATSLTDRDLNTFVKGDGSANPWVVVPLAQKSQLTSLLLGQYEDQSWNGVTISVSADATYNYTDAGGGTWPGMTWTNVYTNPGPTNPGPFDGDFITLPGGSMDVKYIRVAWTGNVGNAMNELQAFEFIPEPASLALLALGASAVLRRRSRRA